MRGWSKCGDKPESQRLAFLYYDYYHHYYHYNHYQRKYFLPVEALEGRAAVAVVADVSKFVAAPEVAAEPVWSIPLVEGPRAHSAPAGYMTVREYSSA